MATLPKTFYRDTVRYVQVQRTRNVAIFQLFDPRMAGAIYETAKIVGEEYPSALPAIADNRIYRTHRLYKAKRRFNFWLGDPVSGNQPNQQPIWPQGSGI